jgi:HPt (histidine-containing phosphotransfer) domain-containing protein
MNSDFLDDIAQSSPEKASQFASIALKDIHERLFPMREYLEQGDLEQAGQNAHAMKSVSMNVGAVEFSELCKDIEIMCKNGDPPETCLGRVMELIALFPALKAELERYIL